MLAICLYKKFGESSFKALSAIKKKYNTSKVGHGGTLDPLAEGVLAVAVGEATKLLPYFELDPKTYIVEMIFGYETLTLDAEGVDVTDILNHIKSTNFKFGKEDFIAVLDTFLGEIEQVPPLFSAIKIDGVRAYDLARNTLTDEKEFNKHESKIKARKVNLYSYKILNFDLPKVSFEISCSGGFYVRSLVRDLASKLNQKAFMSKLKRTKVGKFEIYDDLFNFFNNESNNLYAVEIPINKVLKEFKRLDVDLQQFSDLKNGKIVKITKFDNAVYNLNCDQTYYVYYLNKLVSVVKAISEQEIKVIKNINL